jgi:DNA-binding transcriptional LysR family regulator
MRFYEKTLPLKIYSVPVKFPPMRFYQLWHERSHAAPDVMWLRRMIGEVAAELPQHPQLETAA